MGNYIDITIHKEVRKIHLRFKQEVPQALRSYLRRLGFVHNAGVPNVFHALLAKTYIEFAHTLEKYLSQGKAYDTITIQPSYPSQLQTISNGHFSIARIHFLDNGGSTWEEKVIFDPRRSIATMIAEQYGKRTYGEDFKEATATPREDRSKAKDLFREGHSIEVEVPTASISETKETSQEKSLTNHHQVYTQQTAPKDTLPPNTTDKRGATDQEKTKEQQGNKTGKQNKPKAIPPKILMLPAPSHTKVEIIEIPFPEKANYTARVTIRKNEKGQFYFGVDHGSTLAPKKRCIIKAGDRDSFYPSYQKALVQALKEIVLEIKVSILESKKPYHSYDTFLYSALEAIKTFAEEKGLNWKKINRPKASKVLKKRQAALPDTPSDGKQKNPPNTTPSVLIPKEEAQQTKKDSSDVDLFQYQKWDTEKPYEPIPLERAAHIRKQFKTQGFPMPFNGKDAFRNTISIVKLELRHRYIQEKLIKKIEKEYTHWINILTKEIKVLEEKQDAKSRQSKAHRAERIAVLQNESRALELLVALEHRVFLDELFVEMVGRAEAHGYTIESETIKAFRIYMMQGLFEQKMIEDYPDRSIGKAVRILLEEYFADQKENVKATPTSDYMDKVIAIMHDHYMEGRHLSLKKIEAIQDQAEVPNKGMLWEAVELSWLLWYKNLYHQPGSFMSRLKTMIAFWNNVQPSYEYSDSSKELYKQYSTPCPIGAMIAEYTAMSTAACVFEPSAGNGLLVLGADPKKTHVNEVDKNRRSSLEQQGFATITHINAATPFTKQLTRSFDVMVTNPPFGSWDADSFDKKRIVRQYFNNYRRLDKNRLRLEHVMSGLALGTLKDSGKAALILMGHIYFDDRGFIAKSRPFFNWLYMHYRVDDVINLNGFTLYNKQGAVAKTMLVLIRGRKRNPTNTAIAPTRKEAIRLDVVVNTFEDLWARIKSNIKTPLEILIDKLKIENEHDIL
ncbi:hypothetical protein HN014_10585 [Aquimarina sp. TRL1]|uniref:hypothetical protein n=1 Tax=Aquimarina sp. (strain TRL1) TaxID=2736252 RepID=UPI00158EB413|nr:hypothetical protein [Aquimarina sp. TRL1]QKX05343.1 hypothetical protein HN014_10585 [Aquimarina sp. TRL1]